MSLAFNPSTQETVAGGSLCWLGLPSEFKASQAGETLSQTLPPRFWMKFVENIQMPMYGVSKPVKPSFEETFMTPNFALSREVK